MEINRHQVMSVVIKLIHSMVAEFPLIDTTTQLNSCVTLGTLRDFECKVRKEPHQVALSMNQMVVANVSSMHWRELTEEWSIVIVAQHELGREKESVELSARMLMRRPTRPEVEDFLKRLLAEIAKIPVERISEASAIDEDLRMESVAFVEMQVALEEEFDIQVDPIEVVERNEFGRIVDYLHDLANAERQ